MNNENNLDFNKMLEMLSKMDKKELEEKLKQAKKIVDKEKNNPN